MVFLKKLKKHLHYNGNIIARLESFNPLGSVKDRIGLAMIQSAEEKKMIDASTLPIASLFRASAFNLATARLVRDC